MTQWINLVTVLLIGVVLYFGIRLFSFLRDWEYWKENIIVARESVKRLTMSVEAIEAESGKNSLPIMRIVEIDGRFYCLRYKDPGVMRVEDKGLWRAVSVQKDSHGRWFCNDDDDYLINDEMKVVAIESGWNMRRTDKA